MSPGRVIRLAETARAVVEFWLDGEKLRALEGDTVLTAVLLSAHALRKAEFGPEERAGFCLMGACQDCWIWQEEGPRLRACATPVAGGVGVLSPGPGNWPAQEGTR